MVRRLIPTLFICCALAVASCAGQSGLTTYSFEPKNFHSLNFDHDDVALSLSTQITNLAPEPSDPEHGEGVWLNLPERITVNTLSLSNLDWKDAKIPMCLSYWFMNANYQQMDRRHEVFLKDIVSGDVISTRVDLSWYDGIGLRTRPTLDEEDEEMAGGTLVYNITSFTCLPKYSAEYEIWVKIADIESDHKRVKIDLKENGRLVTRPND